MGNQTEPSDPPSNVKGRVDRFQKQRVPLAIAYAVVKKYGEDGGGRLAATIAYYSFFSVFPALLALTAIVGFVLEGNPDIREDIVDTAVGQFPVIGQSISGAALAGNGLALTVGVAGAIWGGLAAMTAAQHGFNTVWDVPWFKRPDGVRSRVRGLLMLIVIATGLIAASALTGLASQVEVSVIARVGIMAANVAVDIGLACLAFQILTAERVAWRDIWPGAAAAGAAFYVLQNLGNFLLTRYVSGAEDTYGTFAVVIGLLTWFHLASQATLLGAELNVVLSRRLWPRTLFGDELTDGDRRALEGFQRAAARDERVLAGSSSEDIDG